MTFRKLGKLFISVILLLALFTPVSSAAPLERSLIDRPDEVTGYQIHLIYVVTKDSSDEQRDLNGQIDTWVKDSQIWLQKNLGHQLIFDTYQGQVDVTFMQSKYSTAQLCNSNCNALEKLAAEVQAQDPKLSAGKTLYFNLSELLSPTYCGWANYFGNLALGFSKGSTCNWAESISYTGLAQPAKTMIHELFHSFGVSHVCFDDSDLMIGTPECTINNSIFGQIPITLDASHKKYIGGDEAGIDILRLPVWKDGSGSKDYAKLSPTSGNLYLPRLNDGSIVVKVGQISGGFQWGWSKDISSTFTKLTCTIVSGDKKIAGVTAKSACVFDVPAEWRVGSGFTITQEIEIGPYSGTASVSGKLARADYSTVPCTSEICFEGGSTEIGGYCWSSDVERLVLQQLIDGKWQEVKSQKTEIGTGCNSKNPMSTNFKLEFESAGTKIYRIVLPETSKFSIYRGEPFAVLVTAIDVAEPSAAQIKEAQLFAISQGKEADVREAAELQAKKEAEAKAIADKLAADQKAAEEKKAAAEKVAADKKAADEKAAADRKAADEKAAADKLAAAEAAAVKAAAKLEADKAAAAAKAAAAKKITITCVKGKLTKKVTAVKPVCPSGYKKK